MILLAPMAIASLATQALSSGFSFAQGIREKKLMKEAQREADIALREAEGFLEKNQYENLSVPKQDIALARANVDARNQATLQAAQEQGQRGVAAVGGQIGQAQSQQELQLLAQAEQREAAKAQLVAQEEAQTDEQLASLRINTAEGAQQAASDAYAMGNAFMGDAATSALGVLETGLSIPDLYKGKKTGLDTTDMTKTKVKPGTNQLDIESKDVISYQPTGTNRPTIGVEQNTMMVDPNMASNPMDKMNTISLKSNPSFDDVIQGESQIKDYQKFVLSKEGSGALGPQGADGIVGPNSRKKGTSPTLISWDKYGPAYLEYLKNNR
tara:strand:- start:577 stop:1554 length:978 start_codon:yes stop_codon:yes gene_type:complete